MARFHDQPFDEPTLTKLQIFEAAVVRLCFEHGVKRQHAEPVLKKLKKEQVIAADFRVPQIDRSNSHGRFACCDDPTAVVEPLNALGIVGQVKVVFGLQLGSG
jgi:hypothetical protein